MKKFILILCMLSLFLTACTESNVLELGIRNSDESLPTVEIAENNIGFSPLFITEQQEHEENIIKLRVNKKQYGQFTKMFELVFYGDKIYISADIIEGLYAEPEWINITEYCDAYGILYDDLPFMLANVEGYDYTTYHITFYVTLYYGLRRSEVLGLRWSAIDFEKNTLTINHTVVKNLSVDYKDRTKTETSNYTFPLLEDVKVLLLKLKEQQKENRYDYKKEYIDSDYVFAWQDGKLYRPDYITRAFQKVLKQKGFLKMRFHDLRHSTASILHEKGWTLKDIQEWMRHASIDMTADIYTHISNIRKQTMAKDLEKTLIL